MSKRQNNVFWLHVLISLSILKQNYITDETNYITYKKASFDDTQTINESIFMKYVFQKI